MACPIPLPAPVIKAILRSNRKGWPGSMLSDNFKFLFEPYVRRRRPHLHVELSWLDHALHLQIPDGKQVRGNRKRDRFRFAGPEMDPVESAQSLFPGRRGTYLLMDIKLRDLITFASASIGQIETDS